jgi:zinc transport system ATP-binding protein
MNPMIHFEDVAVAFGKFKVLENITFTLNKGDFLHIVGPNGSGKTTLLKLLIGAIPKTSGEIIKADVRMGYLPQKLYTKGKMPMTVKEVIYSGLHRQPLCCKKKDDDLIDRWLKEMDISDLKHQSMQHLSGGQQQRVFLIRALINQPDLLILDEPTSALDPSFREKFHHMLHRLKNEQGMTIIHVTHDLTDAVKSDCLIMYVDQTIRFFGPYQAYQVFEHEGHRHV